MRENVLFAFRAQQANKKTALSEQKRHDTEYGDINTKYVQQ